MVLGKPSNKVCNNNLCLFSDYWKSLLSFLDQSFGLSGYNLELCQKCARNSNDEGETKTPTKIMNYNPYNWLQKHDPRQQF
jgi:hypothetical protein